MPPRFYSFHKFHMDKKIVYFLQAGNPYGYGYGADEIGVINQKDFVALQKKHVVRVASNEEVKEYEDKAGAVSEKSDKPEKPVKGDKGGKGGSKGGSEAEGAEE